MATRAASVPMAYRDDGCRKCESRGMSAEHLHLCSCGSGLFKIGPCLRDTRRNETWPPCPLPSGALMMVVTGVLGTSRMHKTTIILTMLLTDWQVGSTVSSRRCAASRLCGSRSISCESWLPATMGRCQHPPSSKCS